MKIETTTMLVIGGGPAGYVAAIRAAQLGVPTMLIEGARLGGTCLNIGCIPSKALIHAAAEYQNARQWRAGSELGIRVADATLDPAAMVRWKEGIVARLTSGVGALLRRNGAHVLPGWATIQDGKTVDVRAPSGEITRVTCQHLVLATGSLPVEVPGLAYGSGGGRIVSSEAALSPTTIPRRLVVVGAGYIGLELGMAYAKLGSKVTVVEVARRILPAWDEELSRPVAAGCRRLDIDVRSGSKVTGYDHGARTVTVETESGDPTEVRADQVLVAVGRKPRSDDFGLDSLALDRAGRAVRVDDQCRTSMHNVWAIGDLTGEPMLAHRGMAQGEMVAEIVAAKSEGARRRRFEPRAIPAICFTDPEVVSVGLSPAEASEVGDHPVTAQFPFAANGRSLTLGGSGEGFVRVVARQRDQLILGWQAVGAGVSELATAFGQSIEMGATLEDVAGTIHAHPTLGEAVQEAALRALGRALHI
jgi:dihydrolipoamide dehydrogenase